MGLRPAARRQRRRRQLRPPHKVRLLGLEAGQRGLGWHPEGEGAVQGTGQPVFQGLSSLDPVRPPGLVKGLGQEEQRVVAVGGRGLPRDFAALRNEGAPEATVEPVEEELGAVMGESVHYGATPAAEPHRLSSSAPPYQRNNLCSSVSTRGNHMFKRDWPPSTLTQA